MLKVTDDSGFLALVVPAAYKTFVARNWTLKQILAHFNAQMARRSLLIWGTGLEGFWKVRVIRKRANVRGFREVQGPLAVVGGSLLVTNYESLTMAAQFKDVTLPEEHEEDQVVPLPDGNYSCRIIQMFDPDERTFAPGRGADFVVEILDSRRKMASWKRIPWFSP